MGAPQSTWRTVRAEGARVRVLDIGDGDPLLFLHGWGMTPRVYARSLERLCRAGVRVIAPSLPGFDGSDGFGLRELSLARYAERLAEVLPAVGVERPAFVIGHSLGGGVAIRLACDRPDLVRSLTLVNTVGGSPARPGLRTRTDTAITSRPWWQWAIAAGAEIDPRTLLRAGPRTLAGVTFGITRDLAANLARRPLNCVGSALVALGADLAEDTRGLVESGLPVLFVWGDRDRLMTPGAFAEIATEMPAEVVKGRHGWLLTAPDEFAQLLHNTVVVHAMLERSRRGEPVGEPPGERLTTYLPVERRRRARGFRRRRAVPES